MPETPENASEKHDYGPLQTYEITWQNGHVEHVPGHQISYSGGVMFGERGPRKFSIHGEIDGHWLLMLSAPEDDVRIIRNVTAGEWVL